MNFEKFCLQASCCACEPSFLSFSSASFLFVETRSANSCVQWIYNSDEQMMPLYSYSQNIRNAAGCLLSAIILDILLQCEKGIALAKLDEAFIFFYLIYCYILCCSVSESQISLFDCQINIFDLLFVDKIKIGSSKMRWISLVLILVLLGLCEPATKQNRFPHKLWMYWHDPDFANAPIFVQLCYNNIRHFATVSGWELILVNNQTIYQYLSQESNKKLAHIKERLPIVLKTVNPQYLPDIYRVFLLHDNGGMWTDISTIFARDFSWVQNLLEQNIVDNHIAKQPQVVICTYDTYYGGNKTIIIEDEKQQKFDYLLPGFEIWFLIARPRTKFFSAMIDTYIYMLSQQSVESYMRDRKKQEGFVFLGEGDRYFAFSNLQMQIIMQRKQKEIDRNPEKFDIKYALEYYGIWTLDSTDVGFSLDNFLGWRPRPILHALFYQSFSSFPEKIKKEVFFKFTGDKRTMMLQFFDTALAKDCSIKDGAFSKDSFISEYLFKYSEDMPFVKQIRSLEARPKGWSGSECTSQEFGYFFNHLIVKIKVFTIALLLVTFCLVLCLKKLSSVFIKRITKWYQAKAQW